MAKLLVPITVLQPFSYSQTWYPLPSLSSPAASPSVTVPVLSHLRRWQFLPGGLSPGVLSTLSQMFCDTDPWIFPHHCSDQGLSPSGGLPPHLGTCQEGPSASESFFPLLILYSSLAYPLPLAQERDVTSEHALEDSFPFPFL